MPLKTVECCCLFKDKDSMLRPLTRGDPVFIRDRVVPNEPDTCVQKQLCEEEKFDNQFSTRSGILNKST